MAVLVIVSALLYTKKTPPPHIGEMRKIRELLKEGEPAFTAEDIDVFIRDMVPLVEKTTGKKFKQALKIKLVGRDGLAKTLAQDSLPQLRNLMKKTNEDQIVQASKAQAKGVAPFLLGKYCFEENVLHIFKLAKVDKKHTQSIIKIIIAHELTHVLQDQEINLNEKFRKLKGLENRRRLTPLLKGTRFSFKSWSGSS